jgi:pimeloyl-ACP methyl ester carboxylesterase
MPTVTRPDGAVIHYETWGDGFPLLLIAPGGVSSQVDVWRGSAINPIEEFAADFLVIGMDQRHAGESWQAPPEFSYELAAGDQLAVLDALSAERALAWGGCIGVAHLLRLVHDAPERIAAGVGQDPVGLDGKNSLATFMAMFEPTIALARAEGVRAVVASAERDPLFATNNEGGPLAPRLAHDAAFRSQIRAMPAEDYVALIERLAAGYWPDAPPYFTVAEDWVRRCPAPLLILPGSDTFHPTAIAERICAEAPDARCLDVDCRSEAKLPATIEAIRAFLHEHAH